MKINHRAVTSSIFELVKTVELDIQLNAEITWTTRIELFRDTEHPQRYRCHVWEHELFRLTPSFPRDAVNAPAHVTDDILMVERGIARSDLASALPEPFEAPSIERALEMVLDELQTFLEYTTDEAAT